MAAAGHGNKPAKVEERQFLKAAGAILQSTLASLITVDVAMYACSKAGVGASVLAAMAGIPQLRACSAPSLPQAQPLPAQPSGVARMPAQTVPGLIGQRVQPEWDCMCSAGSCAPAQNPTRVAGPSSAPSADQPAQGPPPSQQPSRVRFSATFTQSQGGTPHTPVHAHGVLAQSAARSPIPDQPLLSGPIGLWRMQVPAAMDQVLLEWDGGGPKLLARVRDGAGCWLCAKEVHTKLCSNFLSSAAWYQRYNRGERPWFFWGGENCAHVVHSLSC